VGGFLGRDLRFGPRTFEAMGLAKLEREALRRLLQDGEQ
jgi:opine dehydrogenase